MGDGGLAPDETQGREPGESQDREPVVITESAHLCWIVWTADQPFPASPVDVDVPADMAEA